MSAAKSFDRNSLLYIDLATIFGIGKIDYQKMISKNSHKFRFAGYFIEMGSA